MRDSILGMTGKRQSNSLVRSSLFTVATAGIATFAFLAREGDAHAQTRFGDKGQLVLTAENLFALSTERRAEAFTTGDDIDVTNRFGILYSDRLDSVSPHGPQVGAAYFFAPSMSIGGTIGYESRGGSHTPPPTPPLASVTRNKDDFSTFIFIPRFGYALSLTSALGFYFRGGLGIYRVGVSDAVDSRVKDAYTFWLLALDALFVVTPVQHFGFYVGPQADISFAGSHSFSRVQMGGVVEQSNNMSLRDIGIGAGLLGYFDL
jgi:hypothetical protein